MLRSSLLLLVRVSCSCCSYVSAFVNSTLPWSWNFLFLQELQKRKAQEQEEEKRKAQEQQEEENRRLQEEKRREDILQQQVLLERAEKEIKLLLASQELQDAMIKQHHPVD